jgi:hypothetical protein
MTEQEFDNIKSKAKIMGVAKDSEHLYDYLIYHIDFLNMCIARPMFEDYKTDVPDYFYPGYSKFKIYQHYKGNKYQYITNVLKYNTGEPCALYRAMYGENQLWIRNFEVFHEMVTLKDGTQIKRFKEIRENDCE